MFIKIGNIMGSSQFAGREGEIDVLAWSWGLGSSGKARGGVCVQDISVTKYIDDASAALIMGVTIGETYPQATLTVLSPGDGDYTRVLEVDMTNVKLTSFSTGGSGGEDRLTENVTLNFSEARWVFSAEGQTATVGSSQGRCK